MLKKKLVAGVLALAVAGGITTVIPGAAEASSHREAPLIAQDPVADNTDLYMYRDATDPTKVNIVANYIGLEDPAGGPNFQKFGDDVLYEVHIDNNGDAISDITYQFRFRTTVDNPNTFLYNTGTIDPATYANQNVKQTYSIRKIENNVSTVIATDVPTPPVNVGPRSTPNYAGYVARSVANLPGGGKVFAGQRDDPFFVDLGSIFDLVGLRPLNNAHAAPLPVAPGRDGLTNKSVHSIVLQLPITEVTAGHITPTVVDSKSSVIGAYASSSRQRVQVLAAGGGQPRNLGQFVQVSRLGIPLINEVLIPLGKKDAFNASQPKDDVANFGANILDPEPTKALPSLYPSVFNANNTPGGGAANRPDLVKLITGQIIGLSPANALAAADLLRINLALPAVAGTVQNREGAVGGDLGGFPNGRRLTDDVTDIEIQVLAGVLLDDDGIIDGTQVPYTALGDGVNQSDQPGLNTFPYVGTPVSGYDQPGQPGTSTTEN